MEAMDENMFLFSTGGGSVWTRCSVVPFCRIRCHGVCWWMNADSSSDSMSELVFGTGGGWDVPDWSLWGCIWMLTRLRIQYPRANGPRRAQSIWPNILHSHRSVRVEMATAPGSLSDSSGFTVEPVSKQMRWKSAFHATTDNSPEQELGLVSPAHGSFINGDRNHRVMLCAHLMDGWWWWWVGGDAMTGLKRAGGSMQAHIHMWAQHSLYYYNTKLNLHLHTHNICH